MADEMENYQSPIEPNLEIYSISPISIPTEPYIVIQVNGDGFIAGEIKVILYAFTSTGEWHQEIDADVDSPQHLSFSAPPTPNSEALIATVCVRNGNYQEKCLIESLGYYNFSQNEYPFTPQIGTTSGFTEVNFYVPDSAEPIFCSAMFGKQRAQTIYNQNGLLKVRTYSHPFGVVPVSLCYCQSPNLCITLPKRYKFTTFGYVNGELNYLEVIDTDEDELVDFHPYLQGIQSKIELPQHPRASVFSIKTKDLDNVIPGRFAYVLIADTVAKIDVGTNEIVKTGPPILPPPKTPSLQYKDIDFAFVDAKNIIVIAAINWIDLPSPGPYIEIITLDSRTLNIIDEKTVLLFIEAYSFIIDMQMEGSKAYIMAIGGLPIFHQGIIEAMIDEEGMISIGNVYHTNYQVPDLLNTINIGIDVLRQTCLNQFYECVYYVAPDANELNVINTGVCSCPYPNIGSSLSYPQDVVIGYIWEPNINDYEWKAFVVNASADKWVRVNDLLGTPWTNNAQETKGKTPVACEIRRSKDNNYDYDKVYIANFNSIDDLEESDITVVNASGNIIKSLIKGISDQFKPRDIAIQWVLSTMDYLEAIMYIAELMEDEDFTTPSKRQVLLNRIDVIENLLSTPANKEAIISNIEAFQNQVENYVVNEQRKEELIAYSEALISSLDK